MLEVYNIQAILSILSTSVPKNTGIDYKQIKLADTPTALINKHFREAIDFIEGHIREGRNVLVHCRVGMSRSATLVIAYLMHKEWLSYDEAYKKVKEKRRIIQPNIGFV